ncbi:ATP-binding protein [Actinomadura oligospora]|uniref:ATP-binding protein n=1 Tax=Actinomadura oligospora TaxID=111804 RepID=UPI0004BCD5A5|nr:ATP-binding protein [Actinomadura oligospora]
MSMQITPCSPTPRLAIDRNDQEGVKDARDFLGDLLQAIGIADPDVLYTAKLIVTELVTNAIKHTETADIVLRAYVAEDGRPTIEVDDDSNVRPVVRPITLDSFSGRGLALIDEIAACWGWALLDGGGKTVWAVLDLVVP